MWDILKYSKRSMVQADIDALRLRIARAVQDEAERSLCVIGAARKCGATTITIGLANCMAVHGKSVLVIDANPRKPRIHVLWRELPTPGTSELLDERVSPNQAVRSRYKGRISLLPIGDIRRAESAFSATEKWQKLLSNFCQNGRYVITDAGTVGEPSAAAVASVSKATILVVESGRSSRESVVSAVQTLRDQGVAMIAIILNKG